MKITRKGQRKRLDERNLACELVKVIQHFFPDLLPLLKRLPDPRHQSYIRYPSSVLLMTRILSSICYISSMRKASEEFHSETMIQNIWDICEEENTEGELPYWETINRYLKKLDPDALQEIVCQLCRRLLRSRAFEGMRIQGKYWQILVDGTQLYCTREELDEKSLYRVHKKGTEEEYRENYYYVLEAKLVLSPEIVVSIFSEFVENPENGEFQKQDCEQKACWRLMERLKTAFPRLPICLTADSLYACERWFRECQERDWRYLLRYKEGSIPQIAEEYQQVRKIEGNREEISLEDGISWYDAVNGIDYEGYRTNLVEYGEKREVPYKKGKKKGTTREIQKQFWFLTDLPTKGKRKRELVESGRRRWMIENEGFNTQKRQGYHLEHLYSKDYQGFKNHYYLIQIGHMIPQILEAWKEIWKGVRQSREQKHRRLLESLKGIQIREEMREEKKRFQIRFI